MTAARAADLPVGSIVADSHSTWIKATMSRGPAEGTWLRTGDEMGTYDWDPQAALDLGGQVLRVGDGSGT